MSAHGFERLSVTLGVVGHIVTFPPLRRLIHREILCFVTQSHATSAYGPVDINRITCERCRNIWLAQIDIARQYDLSCDDIYQLEVALIGKYAIKQIEVQHLIDKDIWTCEQTMNEGYIWQRLTPKGLEIAHAAWNVPYMKWGYDPFVEWERERGVL